MAHLHLIALSDEDHRRVSEILAGVPGVESVEEAVAWALRNVTIPAASLSRSLPPPPRPNPYTPGIIDLMSGSHQSINIEPGTHKTDVYKVNVLKLSGVVSDVLVERHTFQRFEPSDKLSVLFSTGELMKLE